MTGEGKLYLCAVKDVYSGRIVGYSIDARMRFSLAVRALESAVARRGRVAGCIVHSDRGSQFRSRKFVSVLARHDLVGSMGRVGAAGDNAAMESFFVRRLKTAAFAHLDYPDARQALQVMRWMKDFTTGKLTIERVYLITSLPPGAATGAQLADWIRGHWKIENLLHHVRDRTFREDDSKIHAGHLRRITDFGSSG